MLKSSAPSAHGNPVLQAASTLTQVTASTSAVFAGRDIKPLAAEAALQGQVYGGLASILCPSFSSAETLVPSAQAQKRRLQF